MDYTSLLTDYQDAYAIMEQDAGYILTENLQDRSVRSALSLAGWKPKKNMEAQAIEWWQFDWEYANTPVRTVRGSPIFLVLTLDRNKALKSSP